MTRVDNIDIYAKYGVTVTNGRKSIIQYPSLKKVKNNNWAEDDGLDIDLAKPTLNSRNVTISFCANGANWDLNGFIQFLSDKGYHIFDFIELEKSYKLRLIEQSELKIFPYLSTFTLTFIDDFPLPEYIYNKPASNQVSQGYTISYTDIIDNKEVVIINDFADYGITILDGSLSEIEKVPKVKQNLLQDINSLNGVIYDGENVNFEAKDVNINLLFKTDSITAFWQNYNAFIYDLIRPNERKLYIPYKKDRYSCHYKSSTVSEFEIIRGEVWCKFSITLVFTSFRIGNYIH